MLRIRYEREASNYFLDNGDLTRDLMMAIEGLFFTDGIPKTGELTPVENEGLYLWVILGHIVVYRLLDDQLIVRVVMPVE